MSRLYLIAVVTVAVVVFGELACTSVPLTSPTGSTISISSDRDVLPLNGQATLRAVVIESSGTPVQNGTVVNFTTTLGNVDPPEARTVNGVATSTFNAGSISGTTTVHAFSGGTKTGSGNSSGGGVSIKIGAAAAGSISISSTPPSVSQSGGTVTISALVLDPAGNPLPGVNVTFSSNAGSLSNTMAVSDANGFARTQLTTTTTATVTASAGSATKDVIVTVTSAPTVTITAAESATEGVPVPINVAVSSGANSSPRQIQTLVVDFGDGTSEVRSNITGAAGFSHTYQRSGGYTITATAVDVGGNTGVSSKAITINAATLPTVAVTATPNPIPAADNGLTTLAITASATGAPMRNVTIKLANGDVLYSGTGNGSVAFRFVRPGSYTVIGTATDANGNTGQTSIVVVAQ